MTYLRQYLRSGYIQAREGRALMKRRALSLCLSACILYSIAFSNFLSTHVLRFASPGDRKGLLQRLSPTTPPSHSDAIKRAGAINGAPTGVRGHCRPGESG